MMVGHKDISCVTKILKRITGRLHVISIIVLQHRNSFAADQTDRMINACTA